MPAKELNALESEIIKHGMLPGGDAYWDQSQSVLGQQRVARPAIQLTNAANATPMTSVQLITVGDAPQGFGKGVVWNRQTPDEELLLEVFLNAADFMGVSISGVQANDRIRVTEGAGEASFAKDKGEPFVSGLIGVVATGVKLIATIKGHPEANDLIDKAAEFAQSQFKSPDEGDNEVKRRDTFGEDPGSGHKARQEGGVIVCLPQANGALYSGDEDHDGRWIQHDGTRAEPNYPKHVAGLAFFPLRFDKQAAGVATQDGQVIILPWDYKFQDNVGFYKFTVHIKSGPGDVIIL